MSDPADFSVYKEHPKHCDPDDYWGQVKRTVGGRPIGEDQIELIVQAVTDGLDLRPDDLLLDLCSGNGALTTRFFAQCRGGLGVDFSPFLVDVARRRFTHGPAEEYRLQDVLEYVREEPDPSRFTKGLCYGSFSYLSRSTARELLGLVRERFTRIDRLFLGNLPDKQRMDDFFDEGAYTPGIEDDPGAPIGVWWSVGEVEELAAGTGWRAEERRMRGEYFAAHYRFDAVLTPA